MIFAKFAWNAQWFYLGGYIFSYYLHLEKRCDPLFNNLEYPFPNDIVSSWNRANDYVNGF